MSYCTHSSLLDIILTFFFFSSRRRHTRCSRDWSSDVCSSDLTTAVATSRGEARHAANECDIKVFCCPKLGNSLEEYEDAWAHRQTRTPVGIRVAVADGATESRFAKLWAVLLAEGYVRRGLAGAEVFARLKPARRLW